jgi:hypothetical protein
MRFCFLVFCFLSCLSFTFSYSQESTEIPAIPGKKYYIGIRLYHENDFIVPRFINKGLFNNTDDNYTGGSKLEITTNLFRQISFLKPLLNPLKGNISTSSFIFGYTTFTPQDLKDSSVIYTDRPYASYRFWGFGVSSVDRDTSWKLYYEILLGSMGRPLAGDIQSRMHVFLRRHCHFTRDVPEGWHNQIGYSQIFTANLTAKLERRIWPSKKLEQKKNFRWVQFSARSELNLGQYMTNISLEPRISLLNWNHNFGEFEDEPSLPSRKIMNKSGFHLFIGIRPKLVIHNATLTGRLGNTSVHTINPSELNNVLMEYNCGFAYRLGGFRVGYNLFVRSKEFSFQNKSLHSWGGFYIGGVFRV